MPSIPIPIIILLLIAALTMISPRRIQPIICIIGTIAFVIAVVMSRPITGY